MVPTSGDVWRALADRQVHPPLVARATEASRAAQAFHWPLEFPDVMAAGGFDAVLGNPPWDVIQLGEEEYFAQEAPEIAELSASEREVAIGTLERERPALFARYVTDKRFLEAINTYSRSSGRYPHTARGKINTYALFSELSNSAISVDGRAGLVVETDIATGKDTAKFFSS
jgi:hypothetical protein